MLYSDLNTKKNRAIFSYFTRLTDFFLLCKNGNFRAFDEVADIDFAGVYPFLKNKASWKESEFEIAYNNALILKRGLEYSCLGGHIRVAKKIHIMIENSKAHLLIPDFYKNIVVLASHRKNIRISKWMNYLIRELFSDNEAELQAYIQYQTPDRSMITLSNYERLS